MGAGKAAGNVLVGTGLATLVLVLLMAGGLVPNMFALVIVDSTAPVITGTGPALLASTTPTSPTVLPASMLGTTVSVTLTIREANPDTLGATVVITAPAGTVTTLAMSYTGSVPLSVNTHTYGASWLMPNSAGLYAFKYTVKDKALLSSTLTVFGSTAVAVDGFFSVDGQKVVSPSDTLFVKSRSIVVSFTATQGGTAITRVFVSARDPDTNTLLDTVTLPETTADSAWSATYLMPQDSVRLSGWVNNGISDFQKMDLLADISPPGFRFLENVSVIGLVAGLLQLIAGIVLRVRD